jgi:hypothetical protein
MHAAISQFQKLFDKYEQWFLKHTETVNKLETALRVALFFLPGRFRDSELPSESCKYKLCFILYRLYHLFIRYFKKMSAF